MVFYLRIPVPVPVGWLYIPISTMLLIPNSLGSLQIVSSLSTVPLKHPSNLYPKTIDRLPLTQGVCRVLDVLFHTASDNKYLKWERRPEGMPNLNEDFANADIDAMIRMAGVSMPLSVMIAAMGQVVDTRLCCVRYRMSVYHHPEHPPYSHRAPSSSYVVWTS